MSNRARLVLGAVVCLVAAGVVWALAVRTVAGQVIENAAMDGRPVRRWWVRDPRADVLSRFVTTLDAAGVAALVVWTVRRRGRAGLVTVVVVLLGTLGLVELLKHRVLDRTPLIPIGDRLYMGPNTFPSGHTAVAAAVAVAAVLIAPPARRLVVVAAGAVLTGAVGVAMLVAELHRPSDLMAAPALAVAVGLLVAAARREPPARPGPVGPLAWVFAAVAVANAAVVVVVLPGLVRSADADRVLFPPQFARAGLVGITGTVAATALAFWLLAWLAPPGAEIGPRTSDRGRTVPPTDVVPDIAPYVANRAIEGSAGCAEQLSSPVAAGDSGGRSPSGSPPTAGT
jgi:membrane-associated phospholipid phosphatase